MRAGQTDSPKCCGSNEIGVRAAAACTEQNAAQLARDFLATIPPYPGGFFGRGIVTCAGGVKYNTCAWVLIRMLRRLGCPLPIQVWYLGAEEEDRAWIDLVRPLGVECIDAHAVREQHPHPNLGGWELKPYAILHSRFREVLFLDADNVPVIDPTFLFNAPEYLNTGAVFWPDGRQTSPDNLAWQVFGVDYRDDEEVESGQLLIDKKRCWKAINLCNWYNENSSFFYRYVYGDKDTFRFAWHRVGQPYSMPSKNCQSMPHAIGQYDFTGRLLFQHRCQDKWSLAGNLKFAGFFHEQPCVEFLEQLERLWSPVPHLTRHLTEVHCAEMAKMAGKTYQFIRVAHKNWLVEFGDDGQFAAGGRPEAFYWWRQGERLVIAGADGRTTCVLDQQCDGSWHGHSPANARAVFRLVPVRRRASIPSQPP